MNKTLIKYSRKRKERSYEIEEKYFQIIKVGVFNCDANLKWIYQDNQLNNNPVYIQKVNTQ